MRKIYKKVTNQQAIQQELKKINYSLHVLPNVTEFPVVSLSDLEGKKTTYHVMRIESVTWECTCEDYRFRRHVCKHIKHILSA